MRLRKAVIPAAGWGTRFLPATKAVPKEMLPLIDRPIIQYAVEEAVAAGVEQVVVVTASTKRAMEDHFDVNRELEALLRAKGDMARLEQVRAVSELAEMIFVRQKEQLGFGHAVLQAKNVIGDEPFAILLPDDLIDWPTLCLGQMLPVFERYGGPVVAVERVPGDQISRYGVIRPKPLEGKVYEVLDLVEKPAAREAPSDLAIIGRYVLTPDLFPVLAETRPDARGEIQVTDALRALRRTRALYAVEFEGKRHDTGDKLGFLKATVEFALARPDLAEPFRAYLKTLKL